VRNIEIIVKRAIFSESCDWLEKMDPYVAFTYDGVKHKTKVKENADKTPDWEELFKFDQVNNQGTIVFHI